jgi:HK97 family phage portal protein
MKLLDNIAKTFGFVKQVDQADRPNLRATFLKGQAIGPAMKASEYLDAYKGWVYSCVSAITQEVGSLQLVLKRRKNQSEFEQVDSHPVLDLLYKVNPLYTSYALWEATEGYLDLLGESYWWLTGSAKKPSEIWTLRPDWLEIKDTKNKMIESYSYGPPGERKITVPFEQVIPFKDFNPKNPYRGYGTIRASAEAIDLDNSASKYNRNFFNNSARPGGALEAEGNLTDEQRVVLREEWERVHKGEENSWKVAILEGGLKWKDVGLSQKDMDYIEGRRFTRDEIFAMYRVPKVIVAVTDDVNRANAREARAVFLENVIEPKEWRIAATLTEFLLPRYGDPNLFFDIVSPVPADNEYQLKLYDNGLKHGWLTRNEVRELEDYGPIDGGDKLLVPFGLQEVGAQTQDQKEAAKKKKMSTFRVRIPPFPHAEATANKLISKISEKAKIMLLTIMRKRDHTGKNAPVKESETPDDHKMEMREMEWRSMIGRTDKREEMVTKTLGGLFNAQEQRVKDRLETQLSGTVEKTKAVKSIDDVADVTGENSIFAGPLIDLIKSFLETEGVLQIQQLVPDAVFYMQSQAIKDFLKSDGVKFIPSINETTTDALREQLAEGVSEGEGIPKLRERIESVFEDARGYRSAQIARTESLRATNFATLEAYKQSGVVEAKEWLTAHDERVCPWCGPLDGKVVSLGDDYFEEGDTITGKNENGKNVTMTVSFTDVGEPPLHTSCRCTLIPVLMSSDKGMKKGVKSKLRDKKQLKEVLRSATLKEVKRQLTD